VNGGHDLFVHIHPGDAISLAVGNEIQHIPGKANQFANNKSDYNNKLLHRSRHHPYGIPVVHSSVSHPYERASGPCRPADTRQTGSFSFYSMEYEKMIYE
jgi:hypothetical protein